MIKRLLAEWGNTPREKVPETLPPLPSRMATDERPPVDFNRWDWDLDALPFYEWRLRYLLYRLLMEQDGEQFRYLQGQARELFEVITTPEVEKALAQHRARIERTRR